MKTFTKYLKEESPHDQLRQLREEKLVIMMQLNELDVGGAIKTVAGHVGDVVKGALGGDKEDSTDDIPQSKEESKRKIDALNLKMEIIKLQIIQQKMLADDKDDSQIKKNIEAKQKIYDTKYGKK